MKLNYILLIVGKEITNCNNAKNEDYYNALMYNTQRAVDECRIQEDG